MEMASQRAVVSLTGLRALTITVLLIGLLLHPSVQFTLVHSSGAQQRAAGPTHDGDAVSAQGKLVASDNTTTPLQAGPLSSAHHHRRHQAHIHAPSSTSTSDSTNTVSIPRRRAHNTTRLANLRRKKTNGGGENFPTSHGFVGETPTENLPLRKTRGESEGVVVTRNWSEEGSTKQKEKTAGGGRQPSGSSGSDKSFDRYHPLSPVAPPLHRDDQFTEVVQVELAQSADRLHVKADAGLSSRGGGSSGAGSKSEVERAERSGTQKAVLDEEEEGVRQSLQQPVPHRTADPHVSKMVLTAIGSLTAIVGVCVMAAIFQCCCRRKRSGSSPDEGQQEQEGKKGLHDQHKGGSSSRSSRSSKSPSPHKALTKDEDNEIDKGNTEKDALLEEDKDLGDFSAVQRETSILRSYRKPPPPKNRARASRVPRGLKAVDPKASPSIFQELVHNEQNEDDTSKTPRKATNGLASPEPMSPDMQSSMLAEIDNELAELHTTHDPSPSISRERSREASAEKQLAPKTGSDTSTQLESPAKPSLPTSPSKEQLAKALAQELSRSREMLSKPQSKPVTPKSSKDTTPKSQSAGASPKTVHSKNTSASSSKDSMGSSNGGENGAGKSGSSPEEGDKNATANFFVLIDPTAKDKGSEAGGKSKIPVRAASSPTQPTAPLRFSTGRDKRFPVPSVHGDQMDQLMKSLKTRLKDDETASPKQDPNEVSPEGDSLHDDSLDPQSRDRSYSDPTKQQDDRGTKLQQTHL